MDIESYIRYWDKNNETLYTYSPAHIERAIFDKDAFNFLTTCGLPMDAAPCLSFSFIMENQLPTPNQLLNIDFENSDDYLIFGSNGSGDPICIDTTKKGEIVYLNHDDYFQSVFINKSIRQFAVCLVKYRDFFLSLIDMGSHLDLKRKFSDDEYARLQSNFLKIDSACLADNSFWATELEALLWERDNE